MNFLKSPLCGCFDAAKLTSLVGLVEGYRLDEGMGLSHEEQFEFPVIWVGVEDASVHMANQVLSQFEEDQFYITFGQLTPPVLLGSEEQMMDQAKRLGYVPVKVITRISLTPRRMREFIEVFQRNLAQYEEKHGKEY